MSVIRGEDHCGGGGLPSGGRVHCRLEWEGPYMAEKRLSKGAGPFFIAGRVRYECE